MSNDAWKEEALRQADNADAVIALKRLARKLGPFTVDKAGYVWCNSAKGGKTVFANVRGWGYLTGQGSGALGLDEDAAIAEQERWAALMTEALNAYAMGSVIQKAEAASGNRPATASADTVTGPGDNQP